MLFTGSVREVKNTAREKEVNNLEESDPKKKNKIWRKNLVRGLATLLHPHFKKNDENVKIPRAIFSE